MRGSRIFARGVQAQLPENRSDVVFWSSTYFTVLQSVSITTIISKGGPTVSRGGGGGRNANFYRNPHNVIFQGGGGSSPPIPLWIRPCSHTHTHTHTWQNFLDPNMHFYAALSRQAVSPKVRHILDRRTFYVICIPPIER